jgi:MEMO1 family protein
MSRRKRTLPGGWYPTSANECERDIEGFLRGFAPPEGTWYGGVAPHAGWFFSGKAAAKVLRTLSASRVDRVILYGGHLGGDSIPIVYTEDSWETPLGPHLMDTNLARELVSSGEAVVAGSGFADNTVEIMLPFVKRFFPETPLMAVHSPASLQAVKLAELVDRLLREKGLRSVCIGSADLTHYGPNYGFAPKGAGQAALDWVKNENDRSLIDKALAMDAEGMLTDAGFKHNTCSAGPIASVMSSAARRGVKQGRLLEYYTSHDVMAGSSFVGYAAIVY